MNAQQIDPSTSPSRRRVVGHADGQALQAKLAEGFLCGPWSKKRKAYAVMRKPEKCGRRSRISSDLTQEALRLRAEIDERRVRLNQIAAAAGVSENTLRKRIDYLRSKR